MNIYNFLLGLLHQYFLMMIFYMMLYDWFNDLENIFSYDVWVSLMIRSGIWLNLVWEKILIWSSLFERGDLMSHKGGMIESVNENVNENVNESENIIMVPWLLYTWNPLRLKESNQTRLDAIEIVIVNESVIVNECVIESESVNESAMDYNRRSFQVGRTIMKIYKTYEYERTPWRYKKTMQTSWCYQWWGGRERKRVIQIFTEDSTYHTR